MTILIPAYEPTSRLIELVTNLKYTCTNDIVIINDGSGENYQAIFDEVESIGCIVLTHEVNKGKGEALKTGFRYLISIGQRNGVVTADCDGQHLPADIRKVLHALDSYGEKIILGSRKFVGKVPLRSKLGNSMTRSIFRFTSGIKLYDTQTGLRGFSASMLPWLCTVQGTRFEYEMNILLEAESAGYGFHEIDIDTVYLEQNESSHFHYLKDSYRVYLPILKFSFSSIASAFIDFILLAIIFHISSNLFLAVVIARICSALFNFTMNKKFVFQKDVDTRKSLLQYGILASIVMFANYGVLQFYFSIGISLLLAKILTETTIFLFSYWAQRKFVFAKAH